MRTQFNEDPSKRDAAQHQRAKLAGAKLVEVVKSTAIRRDYDTRHSRGALFEHEKKVLDDCFRAGQGSSTFARYHVKAVRAAIKGYNMSVLQALLSKDQTQRVLDGEQDILQLAIAVGDYWYDVQSEGMARLLVGHGAKVNSLDNDGNTPLYYCCLHGYPRTFRYLIDQGAGVFTLHNQVPSKSALTASAGRRKRNLLQVAAFGFDKCEAYDAYVYARWSSIVTFLVKAGLNISLDNPAETAFFTAKCYEGELDTVCLLLERGLKFDLGRKPAENYADQLAPGLHAAVFNGHHLVVLHLLQSGCQPTWTCSYRGEDRKEHHQTAIAAACTLDSHSTATTRPPGFFLACEAILNAGASDHDARLLLEEAAKQDELNTVRRILDAGTRLEHVPPCRSSRVAQALLETGAALDPETFLTYAVRWSSLDMLEWLDKKYGPSMPPEGFGWDLRHATNDMLRHLITEYGRDSPAYGPCHAAMCTDILRIAARSSNLEIVDMVLSQDSASGCYGFQHVARELLRDRLCSWYMGTEANDIEMYQLLLSHIKPEAGAEYAERPRIWLRPSMLPPDLMDKSFASADEQPRTQTPLHAELTESSQDSSPSPGSDVEESNSRPRYKHPAEEYCGDMPLRAHIPLPTPPSDIPHVSGSKFAYGRLDGPFNIRLLILEPSQHIQAPIKGRLVQKNLSQKPKYEALSYVWGDPTNKIPISLHGTDFMVTRNLWEALCRLRLPKDPRLLWIDAICINQDDLDERNQQVGIMKNIYQSAKRVAIWMGEEADDSHLIFQHVRMWKKYRDDYGAGLTRLNDGFHEAHINPPKYNGRTEEAIQNLCRRPWFFRTWTIQEKALSRDAVIVCGQDAEDWSLLFTPMTFCMNGALDALEGVHGSTHMFNLAKLGVNPGAEAVIEHSRLCQATDPRDKVYGLLGLFKRPLVPVDYSLSFEAVYTRFTREVIQQENGLRLLHLFGSRGRKQSLPSWVPDFSTTMPISLLPRVIDMTRPVNPIGDYMARVPPSLRFHGNEMSLKGCNLDTIDAVSDELVADVAYAPGKGAFTEVMQKWESLAVQLQQKQSSHPIIAAFLGTLRAQEKKDINCECAYSSAEALAWYDKFGTGILGSFEKASFRELEVISEWYRWKRSRGSIYSDAESYTNYIKQACYGRSFFITRNGSMGLAPPRAAAGDRIVCFPGGLYPFVLRSEREDKFVMVGDCYLHNFCEFDFTMEDVKTFEEFILV